MCCNLNTNRSSFLENYRFGLILLPLSFQPATFLALPIQHLKRASSRESSLNDELTDSLPVLKEMRTKR